MLCVQSAGNETTPEGTCLAIRICCIRNHRKADRICSFSKDSTVGGEGGGVTMSFVARFGCITFVNNNGYHQ
jgi:hypothetical protein